MFYTKDGKLALSRVMDHGVEYVDIRTGSLNVRPHKVPDLTQREPFILAQGATETDVEIIRDLRKRRQESILKAIQEGKDKPKAKKKRSSTPRLSKRMQEKAGHLSKEDQLALMLAMKNIKID